MLAVRDAVFRLASVFEGCHADGETLADWCLYNLSSDDQARVRCLGLPEVVYSGVYPRVDQNYEYQHFKLPRHLGRMVPRDRLFTAEELYSIPDIRLDPGWTNYERYSREPRIVLLRWELQLASASGGQAPQDPQGQPSTRSGGQAPQHPQVQPAARSGGQIPQHPQWQPAAKGTGKAPEQPQGQLAGEAPKPPQEQPAAGSTDQAEQQPQQLTLDEQFAKAGLAMKLFFDQTPDWAALSDALEQVAEKIAKATLSVQVAVVSQAFVILRAIRGTAGIMWASDIIIKELAIGGETPGDPQVAMEQSVAGLLRVLPDANKNWLAHREGRHYCLSGKCALEAMACSSEESSECAVLLEVVVSWILARGQTGASSSEGESPEMPRGIVLLALSACTNRLPLSRAGAVVKHAGAYNAMNAGLALLGWGWRTGRCRVGCFEEVVMRRLVAAQSDKAKESLQSGMVMSAQGFERKFNRLCEHATPVLAGRGGGKSPLT